MAKGQTQEMNFQYNNFFTILFLIFSSFLANKLIKFNYQQQTNKLLTLQIYLSKQYIYQNHVNKQINIINRYNQKSKPYLKLNKQMTLRRIHNNIHTLKQQQRKHSIQVNNVSVFDEYDEQQPQHPKTFVQSSSKRKEIKWDNKKIKEDIGKIIKNKNDINNKNDIKITTARQSKRNTQAKIQTGKFTALNSSRNSRIQVNTPSINSSPSQQPTLFIPQRKKIQFRKNKFTPNDNTQTKKDFQKRSISSLNPHQKQTNQNISYNRSTIQHYFNQDNQNQQVADKKIPQLKSNTQGPLNSNNGKSINNKLTYNLNNTTIHNATNLRRYERQQKQRQKLLSNRLKFITVDNQRQRHKVQFVKRKFQKVVSVRSSFLKQKQTINKKKLQNYLNQMNKNHSRIMQVKQHEHSRKLSLSRFNQSRTLQASAVRQQSKSISREVYNRKINQLNKNKQIVRHAQTSLQNSRQKISQINRSRISSVRSIENKKLIKNYINVENRQKVNEKLYQTLQREISLINQRKLKAASQLKQYESFLRLDNKKAKQISLIPKVDTKMPKQMMNKRDNKNVNKIDRVASSTFNSSGSKSFYLTNY